MKTRQLMKRLKEKYKDEKVFVVLSSTINNIPDKFNKETDNKIWTKYDTLGKFIYRYDAEYDSTYQQIIPYALITNKTKDKYYVSKRIKGDTRLIDNLSLGFGGHINPCDGSYEIVLKALGRELNEELILEPTSKAKYLGTVRDLTSKTKEHLGLVFVIETKEDNVSIKEKDNLEGIWMTKQEMYDNYSKFEGWSKYILSYLYDND